MPIPPFENHDHISEEILPTGVHAATLSEIEDGLVAAFPDSQRRPALFQGWSMYRSWLLSLVDGQARVFINGSFVTSRLEPSDIDMSIEIELAAPWSETSEQFGEVCQAAMFSCLRSFSSSWS